MTSFPGSGVESFVVRGVNSRPRCPGHPARFAAQDDIGRASAPTDCIASRSGMGEIRFVLGECGPGIVVTMVRQEQAQVRDGSKRWIRSVPCYSGEPERSERGGDRKWHELRCVCRQLTELALLARAQTCVRRVAIRTSSSQPC